MLTPIDIDNYAFKRAKIGGYDVDSVEEFMEMLSIDYETLYKENNKLKEDVVKAYQEVEGLKIINARHEEEKDEIKLELKQELQKEIEQEMLEKEEEEKPVPELRQTNIVKEMTYKSKEENFEEICESMKTSAYFEAEEILRRANEVAETKINEVDSLIKEKKSEYEDLKKQIQLYKIRFEAMLQTQLKLLNNPEFEIPDSKKLKK